MTDAADQIAQLQAENAALRGKLRHSSNPASINPDELYSVADAAHALAVSKRMIDLWSRQPDGPKVTRLHPNQPRKYRGIDLLIALSGVQEG